MAAVAGGAGVVANAGGAAPAIHNNSIRMSAT